MLKRIIGLAAAGLLASSCSSIISKSEYAVTVNSDPDAANFSISNRLGQRIHTGVTPATVTLKSSAGYFKPETYSVDFEKAGFASKSFTITASIDGWYFGNILFGGVIGMLIVDPATGAMYNLPGSVDILLNPQRASTSELHTLTIASTDSLSAEQRSRLELIHE